MTSRAHPETPGRNEWHKALSLADKSTLIAFLQKTSAPSDIQFLRKPEVGLAMVRGRCGGTGNPFNLGEVTVTRCVVTFADTVTGEQVRGVACVTGRDKERAEAVARLDAIFQDSSLGEEAIATVLPALNADREALLSKRASRAAATKVDFFTMERGH